MTIAHALKVCISSRKRFSTTEEAIEAVRMIACLPVADWPAASKESGVTEHALPGLVNQCCCSVRTIEWMDKQCWGINWANLHRVVKRYSTAGHDIHRAYQEPWRLYWGAWFLETRIRLPSKNVRRLGYVKPKQ